MTGPVNNNNDIAMILHAGTCISKRLRPTGRSRLHEHFCGENIDLESDSEDFRRLVMRINAETVSERGERACVRITFGKRSLSRDTLFSCAAVSLLPHNCSWGGSSDDHASSEQIEQK